eukprot:362120-Chlamydomonas_euryale.AAC.12
MYRRGGRGNVPQREGRRQGTVWQWWGDKSGSGGCTLAVMGVTRHRRGAVNSGRADLPVQASCEQLRGGGEGGGGKKQGERGRVGRPSSPVATHRDFPQERVFPSGVAGSVGRAPPAHWAPPLEPMRSRARRRVLLAAPRPRLLVLRARLHPAV